ncbi:MAG: DUF6290 family protein [Lactobacillales bacterium]|jgi:stalled ribosome rescue protein Dom34|nr:DUF6290 family protein [Lactobacillales bacterium]
MSNISIRLNQNEEDMIRNYMKFTGIYSISEFFKKAAIEKIEDDMDIELAKQAVEEFKKDPMTYSHEEVLKELEF